MSDLFKKHRPRLSEDEERALWERVRTIPREAGGRRPAPAGARRRPWWDALGASPALRFGVPALAAAVVAVVWVMQKEPVPPAKQEAMRRAVGNPSGTEAPLVPAPLPESRDAAPPPSAPPAATTGPSVEAVPPAANESAPAPGTSRLQGSTGAKDEATGSTRSRSDRQEEEQVAQDLRFATPPAPPSASSQPRAAGSRPTTEALAKEGAAAGVSAGSGTTAEPKVAAKQRAAVPVSPQAVEDFHREKPQTGTLRAAEPDADGSRVASLRAARGSRMSAALMGDRILIEVLAPSKTGTFLETVTLPISGGTARIAAANTPGALVVEDGNVRDLVRIAGSEDGAGSASVRRVDLSRGVAGLVSPDGRALHAGFVPAGGGDERMLAGPRSSSRTRVAALAAELVLALGANDASGVVEVNAAARRLLAERPNDVAVRALAAWTDDARIAFADSE